MTGGDLFLADLAALRERIASLRGRALLLHHFATWCEPCAQEMPLLRGAWEEFRAEPRAAALLVSWDLFMSWDGPDKNLERVRAFLEEHGLDLPAAVYTGGPDELFAALDIPGGTVPLTVVYDPAGDEALRLDAPLEGARDADRLRAAIRAALAWVK